MKSKSTNFQRSAEPGREPNAESESQISADGNIQSYFLVRSPSQMSAESPSPKNATIHESSRNERKKRRQNAPEEISMGSSASRTTKNKYIADWNEQSLNATLLSSSWTSEALHARHPADPPRSPKQDYEWVWFPEGYWAERPLSSFNPSHQSQVSSSRQTTRPKWWNRTPSPDPKTPSPKATNPIVRTPDKVTTSMSEISKIIRESSSRNSRKASSMDEDSRRRSESYKSIRSLQLGGFSFIKRKSDDESTQDEKPLGLYCRTKKTLRELLLERSKLAMEEAAMAAAPGLKSRTTVLLEGTSQYLSETERERIEKKCAGFATPRSIASHATFDGRLRRGFGLAPWHRRNSHESVFSATSSIRQLLMGKNPAATPNLDGKYVDANGDLFERVDLCSPDPRDPTCLPSEARRINTPPMEPGTPNINPRGFFFDLASPPGEGDSVASPSEKSHHSAAHLSYTAKGKSKISGSKSKSDPQLSSAPSTPGSTTEWWEADTKHTETGKKTSGHKPKNVNMNGPMHPGLLPGLPASFVLELPEHLPNSPLCPKNPAHKSGGSGICPSHGRRRSVGLKKLERMETESWDTTKG